MVAELAGGEQGDALEQLVVLAPELRVGILGLRPVAYGHVIAGSPASAPFSQVLVPTAP